MGTLADTSFPYTFPSILNPKTLTRLDALTYNVSGDDLFSVQVVAGYLARKSPAVWVRTQSSDAKCWEGELERKWRIEWREAANLTQFWAVTQPLAPLGYVLCSLNDSSTSVAVSIIAAEEGFYVAATPKVFF